MRLLLLTSTQLGKRPKFKSQKKITTLFALLLIVSVALCQPVISSFTPASGPVGTLVTITGTNLNNPTAFTIGGRTAIVVSNTGNILVGLVMPGAVTGAVSISSSVGTGIGGSNFTVTPTPYPSIQQGSKLVGTGNVDLASQGVAVAVSADGNTAIVGGYTDDNSTQIPGVGAAWVFTRSGNTWSQQGIKLVGTGSVGSDQQGVFQGFSVALSADGNTAIIGGYGDNNNQGAVWVFTRSGNTWSQQGSKLVGTGSVGTTIFQGGSVALSADGNTAIIGGYGDNNNQGAVWVFTRNANTWSQQGNKLVGSGNQGTASFGRSVALSADGNTVIVGGSLDNNNQGAAWVFTRSGNTWSQQGSKLVGTGSVGTTIYRGISVALSADGNTAIVGAFRDNNNQGAAWVFTRSGNTWSQQGPKLVGTSSVGTTIYRGYSVALSADGNTAIIGGFGDNSRLGATWVFTRSGSTWSQQGPKLVGTGSVGVIPSQGAAVAISADGNTTIVGGNFDDGGLGATWVFIPCTTPLAYAVIGGGSYCSGGTGVSVGLANSQTGVNYQLQLGGINIGNALAGTGSALSFGNQTAAGIYTVIATSGNCTATTMTGSVTITINPNPVIPTITAGGPITFCQGGSVVLSGNDNSGTWSTGATTNSITVTTSGTFFVTNTNNCGSVNSNNISITVNQIPSASTITGATTFCQGSSVVLSGNNNGGTWNTGETTSSITVTSPGIYFVTNTNNCGSNQSNNTTVTVIAPPNAPTITADGATTFCQGGSVVLIGNNNGGTWSTGATTSSITATSSGTYFVTNANSCGSVNSNSINVTVNQAPAASTISASGATTFCQGGSVVLSGNNNGGSWSTGAITSSITVTSSGTYFVTNTNNCGSTQSTSINVIVNNPPAATTIIAGGASTFCQGGSVVISGNNNGGIWSTGATSSSITVTSSGTYFVTNSNNCGSINSNIITVTVDTLPTVSFTELSNYYPITASSVTLTGSPAGGTFSGPGISGNTFNPSVAGVGGPFNITYTYTNSNGCTNSSSQQTSITNATDIMVYPNPAVSEVEMTLPDMVYQSRVTVIDMCGKLVMSSLNYTGNKIQLDIRKLAKGNYIIRIQDNNHFYTGKFMKG